MIVSFHPSALKKTKWFEYAARFLFGGAASLLAMILAERFGPAFAGLFLAFPEAMALDAAGATLGAIGLAGFALAVWNMLPDYGTGFVLLSATLTWLALAIITWLIWKKHIW